MKFLFFSSDPKRIYKGVLDERSVGGGPASVIRLGEALSALGHEVFLLTDEGKDDLNSNPRYISRAFLSQVGAVDIVVAVKGWKELLTLPIRFKKAFYWTGESHLNPNTLGFGDKRVANLIDALLPKSQWQGEKFFQEAAYPLKKMWVLPNGVHLDNFKQPQKRERHHLIYASTPLRGVNNLAPIFLALKKKYPDLELYIYSSFDRYDKEEDDTSFEHELRFLKNIPGCHVHKSILQKDLALQLMRSRVLIYPTAFLETCSNVTLEAQAAGCVPVTSDLASLPETVGDAGILIRGLPGESSYDRLFLEAVDCLLSDDALFNKLSERGKEKMRNCDWKDRAVSFLQYLKTAHGIS
jgi:glycosyltransferase involved in cell wall biosynthesis